MNRSLLNRLPDIIALARERARELTGPLSRPSPLRRARQPPWPESRLAHPGDASRRVTLLCGDGLPVMLGLLAGRGHDGVLTGQVPLIWLDNRCMPPLAADGTPLGRRQQRIHQLIDLTVQLFVVRELLSRNGLLVTPVCNDPDRCVERVLDAVFGQTRRMPPVPSPQEGGPGTAMVLAGADVRAHHLPSDGPALLQDLVERVTLPNDSVVVLGAAPACAGGVAALDRRWILVQPDALVFALLKEHVIARHMGQTPQVRAREATHDWVATP